MVRRNRAGALWTTARAVLKAAVLVLLGALGILFLWAWESRSLPDLKPYHRIAFGTEFTASDAARVRTLKDYRATEAHLMGEVRAAVTETTPKEKIKPLSRFDPESRACPWGYPQDYNRTYERSPASPRGSVLLLHGLTDSPYSMRSLADLFEAEGLYVLALRLPGHGTAPSGLLKADRRDWREAVKLGARHAATKGTGGPFYIGGYSCGGALSVQYALDTLADPSLPKPRRLFLFSPAIGITRFAALANILRALSFLPPFEKSKWSDILPEYDPYKYNSFPLNAANESYRLTRDLRGELEEAGKVGRLGGVPPVMAFMSSADNTVLAQDTADVLFRKLPAGEHELVLFDLNRLEAIKPFFRASASGFVERIEGAGRAPFRMTVIANRDGQSPEVVARRYDPRVTGVLTRETGLAWPRGVFSLSHVAVPFPLDDPLYGLTPASGHNGYHLGNIELRGEDRTLSLSLGGLLRLRSNPFFPYMAERIREVVRKDLTSTKKIER